MSGFFFNCIFLFFFVKQNTAYEMRISDWSSDVCSSDLLLVHPDDRAVDHRVFEVRVARPSPHASRPSRATLRCIVGVYIPSSRERLPGVFQRDHQRRLTLRQRLRSEEHTSELQSLMRISYAVFCLKKKKQIKSNIS